MAHRDRLPPLPHSNEELAVQLRRWRGNVPIKEAAEFLGIPRRTFENIEQGSGFAYARMLKLAIQTIHSPALHRRFGMEYEQRVRWPRSPLQPNDDGETNA